MGTNTPNEVSVNNPGLTDLNAGEQNTATVNSEKKVPGSKKKKFHSSALYAARMGNTAVSHVKPTHGGLNL